MEKKRAIQEVMTVLEIEALLRESKVDEAYSQLIELCGSRIG